MEHGKEKMRTESINRGIASFYERIHGRYDLVNSLITFGLDQIWRRGLIDECRKLVSPHALVIDLCTGTGKTARGLRRIMIGKLQIVGLDFSLDMLKQGRYRAKGSAVPIDVAGADARFLPFSGDMADVVVTTFATRNLDARPGDFEQVMNEVRRILKPGGFWLQLETSQPSSSLVRRLFHLFVALWVPLISMIVGEDRGSYRFLADSIRRFDSPDGLRQKLLENGFVRVEVKPYFLGAASLLLARKGEEKRTIPASAT